MRDFTVDAARSLPGPDWLTARRTAAAEEFAATALPTVAAEEWRYSPIGDLDLDAYRLASAADADVPGLLSDLPADEVAAVIDVVNGRVVSITGMSALTACGIAVGPVDAVDGGAECLGSVVNGSGGDCFALLNDAFAPSPVFVDVPSSAMLDGVILVRHFAVGAHTASFPRLVVRVGSNADVKVFHEQTSSDPVLSVPVVELDVGPAARLGYVNVQRHHSRAWQIALHAARVGRDATLVGAVAGLGGAYARTKSDTILAGRGATGDLLSAYFGSGSQTLDFRTFQDHAAPDTTSNLLYVGAVGDAARSVYTGLIRVRPDARGTNAFQTNRNLKLSAEAWAESVPNLEIENNEVRCSHASTVGPVDADQIYYLESRGVPTPVAERLIVSGFFEEVLTALPVAIAEPIVRAAISAKLDGLTRSEGGPGSFPLPTVDASTGCIQAYEEA